MQIQQMMAHPDDMTLHVLMQEEGIIAKKLGDVVYLMQCKPVHVELGVPKYCTNELPVVYNNSEYYLNYPLRFQNQTLSNSDIQSH